MNPRSFYDYEDFFGPYLGSVLLRARKEKGVSQLALAETVHVSDGTLRRIEIGQGPMRPKLVMAICEALDLRLTDVVLEALFSFWMDFQRKAEEGGDAGSANSLGPYRRLRENVLDKFDANTRTERELMEARLDMEAFIHFKRRLEDLKG
ncbi:MAG TPA: helix-turn-helix transcriptional regulator [Thermoanaerobaculia bacterium]|nr:helix-turn-helix transcriptional regulator [Thermoanaerobaculia bacterium]